MGVRTRTYAHTRLIRCLVAIAILGATPVTEAAGVGRYLARPPGWFTTQEARVIADNLLTYQSELGGWPKNIDTTAKPFAGKRSELVGELGPTFDNGATTDELRFLARIFNATHEARYRSALERGLDYILKAQYPNGGWPQSHPADSYHRYITFNDDTMVRLMELVREVGRAEEFQFLNPARREAARKAFDRGLDCILRCQIKANGKLTAWCSQHDEKTLAPRGARTYELPSLSGSDSAGIVRLLMSVERPSPAVVRAIESAVAWFRAAQLRGIRVVRKDDSRAPRGFDRLVVEDATAPPIWARFYDLRTNKPFYCDRDGVKKNHLHEIGIERRTNYQWLGYWPQAVLEREYPAWRQANLKSK